MNITEHINSVIIYLTSGGETRIDIKIKDGLSQSRIVELSLKDRSVVSRHAKKGSIEEEHKESFVSDEVADANNNLVSEGDFADYIFKRNFFQSGIV